MKTAGTEHGKQGAVVRLVAAVCNRQAKHPTGLADAIRRHGRTTGADSLIRKSPLNAQ